MHYLVKYSKHVYYIPYLSSKKEMSISSVSLKKKKKKNKSLSLFGIYERRRDFYWKPTLIPTGFCTKEKLLTDVVFYYAQAEFLWVSTVPNKTLEGGEMRKAC